MAIVKLSKIKLFGINEDKKMIIDLLYKSKLVHIVEVEKFDGITKIFNEEDINACKSKMQKVQKVIDYYDNKDKNFNKIIVKENNFVDFETNNQNLISNIENINEIFEILDEKTNLINEIKSNKDQFDNQDNLVKNLYFLNISVPVEFFNKFKKFLDLSNTIYYKVQGKNKIEIFAREDEIKLIEEKIDIFKLKIESKENKIINQETYDSYLKNLDEYNLKNSKNILKRNKKNLNLFKTYYDYLKFELQKLEIEKDLGFTKKTFMLEGFVENENKQILENLLKSTNLPVSYEFSNPDSKDIVPTKTKNKKFIKPFEFVTNMYSIPKYNEIDPNFFVGIFFSLFFGFIMADIGYGIILMCIGLVLSLKKKTSSGMKALMKVVSIGGFFSILFGVMFGSCLGFTHSDFSLIPKAIFPNPSNNVMTYLIASVVIGAIQIMVSFALKGILLVRRGKIAQAICSAFAWDLFFVGAGIAALDIFKVTNGLLIVGVVVAILGVATSVIGNIVINKGFERVSKSFGSLYSILNLFSDLLSYTRLFGLMLSGVIIASIVNQLAGGFFETAWKVPFGLIILFIGHAFNISMGALGAYIHDARLQYIEFFSRFYEGEGVLFQPFGSDFSYIKLI